MKAGQPYPPGLRLASRRLPASFFLRSDVARIARDLLGRVLATRIGRGPLTAGMIVETEAYGGALDRASHAYGNRRTARTEVMFRRGGIAYVYLCYGLHSLFNIITNREGVPDAVLIRAIRPLRGIERMLRRRGKARVDGSLTSGPGALAQALGISREQNGLSLQGNTIWLETGIRVRPAEIATGPRIGVDYAGADARRPWRFWLRGSAGGAGQAAGFPPPSFGEAGRVSGRDARRAFCRWSENGARRPRASRPSASDWGGENKSRTAASSSGNARGR